MRYIKAHRFWDKDNSFDSKGNVCILTSAHSAFDTRIFHKQAKTLAKTGYGVTLIAQHDKDEIVDGVRIISLPKPHNRLQRMIKLTFQILRTSLKEKANVYHFHDPELIPIGLFLKLFTNAKIIYDVHEDYPATIRKRKWLPFFMRNIAADVFNLFEKICFYLFDAVIPATKSISKRFKGHKVVILHNYPILHYTTDKVNPKSYHKENTIIYAGAIRETYGISKIVKSLEYIDENLQVKLKLLGKFIDSNFEAKITSMEVFSKKVDFIGFVPHKEVYSHLSTADIGLVLFHPLPNYIEAMPNKLFEYMSAGLPVIASNFPLWKEIVEGNNCGLTVNPLNLKEIVNTIEYLLKRPELMEEMGKNSRKVVLEKYNWEQESKKLLNLYANILD